MNEAVKGRNEEGNERERNGRNKEIKEERSEEMKEKGRNKGRK
jgi:hypothetical protein